MAPSFADMGRGAVHDKVMLPSMTACDEAERLRRTAASRHRELDPIPQIEAIRTCEPPSVEVLGTDARSNDECGPLAPREVSGAYPRGLPPLVCACALTNEGDNRAGRCHPLPSLPNYRSQNLSMKARG